MRTLLAIVVMLSILCGACALTPQSVTLKPAIQIPPNNIAKGRQVALNTVDERTRSVIGSRGVGGFGAHITTQQDVAVIVNDSIAGGLRQKGFDVQTIVSPNDPKELRVEIRNLEYTLTPGIFVGTLRTEAAIKGVCNINKNREYERLYRADSSESVLVVQFAEENEQRINESLSKVLRSMLDDDQLIKCLLK